MYFHQALEKVSLPNKIQCGALYSSSGVLPPENAAHNKSCVSCQPYPATSISVSSHISKMLSHIPTEICRNVSQITLN